MKPSLVVTLAVNVIALVATAGFAIPAGAQGSDNDPDLVEIRHYRLTMDKIEKFVSITQQVASLAANDPDLQKRMEADSESDDKTLEQMVKRYDSSFPSAVAVIHRNGMSTREYFLVSLAFMNDYMIVGTKKQGAIKEYPPNAITPENAAFVEQNFDKLKAIVAKMNTPDSTN
jgi:hypothetical protein